MQKITALGIRKSHAIFMSVANKVLEIIFEVVFWRKKISKKNHFRKIFIFCSQNSSAPHFKRKYSSVIRIFRKYFKYYIIIFKNWKHQARIQKITNILHVPQKYFQFHAFSEYCKILSIFTRILDGYLNIITDCNILLQHMKISMRIFFQLGQERPKKFCEVHFFYITIHFLLLENL